MEIDSVNLFEDAHIPIKDDDIQTIQAFLDSELQDEVHKIVNRKNKKISLYTYFISKENQECAMKLQRLYEDFYKKKDTFLEILDRGHIDVHSSNPIEQAIGRLKQNNSLNLSKIQAIGKQKKDKLSTMAIIDDIRMIGKCSEIIRKSSIGTQKLNEAKKEAIRRVVDLDLMTDIKGILAISMNRLSTNLSRIDISKESVKKFLPFKNHSRGIFSLAYSPCGRVIATGSADHSIKTWNAKTGEIIHTFESHSHEIWGIDYSPCGRYLASASRDSTVKLWEVQTGELLYTMNKHGKWVYSVRFSPCGNFLVSGGSDKTVCIWRFDNHLEPHLVPSANTLVKTVAFSPCGNSFAAGGASATIYIWKTFNCERISSYRAHTNTVRAIQFSSSGRFIISAGLDKNVKVFDLVDQCVTINLTGHTMSVVSLNLSPCGNFVVTGSLDKRVKVWEIWSRRLVYSSNKYKSSVKAVVFSPNGKYVATGELDGILQVWKVANQLYPDE